MKSWKLYIDTWPFWLGLLAGLFSFTLGIVGYDLSHFPGDFGDARFNAYILEHAHQYFVLQSTPTEGFWNAPFMYPAINMITYSDNLLGTFPIFSFFRLIGCDVYRSFQLWYVSLTILNYTAAFYFLKWLLKNREAAVLGAFVFAFSMALQSQIFHAQTFPRFPIPLAIWAVLLFVKRKEVKYFFYAVLLVVYQMYCGIYLGMLLLLPITILGGLGFLLNGRSFLKKVKNILWSLKFLACIPIGLALLLPILYPYYQHGKIVEASTYEGIVHTLPVLKSYLFAHYNSIFWQSLSTIGVCDLSGWGHHQLFPGGIAIFSVVFLLAYALQNGKKLYRNKLLLGIAITSMATFALYLNVEGHSLYKWVMKIPGYDSMRALQRIINIELLFFAIAVGLMYLLLLRVTKYKTIFFLFFTLLLVGENKVKKEGLYTTSIAEANERVNSIIEKIGSREVEIISLEPDSLLEKVFIHHLDAMLAAQQLGIKTLNGYSGTSAKGFGEFWHKPNAENRNNWCKLNNLDQSRLTILK